MLSSMPRPVSNPPNPWASMHVEWLGEPPPARLEVFEEEARSVVSENDSPDVPFRWSVNPYRGCIHGCAYCYARPGHQYLGWGAGTDFDRKIVVKVNAPSVLARELSRASWRRESITFSGVTDCYQPLEASYGLTRRCLEVCRAHRTPVAIITKGTLIRRDRELLAAMKAESLASVYISIPFLDDATARRIEPFAAAPSQRFETLRLLSEAGIPTGIALAPVIPGLNDSEIPRILDRAKAAGANRAFLVLLRLPAEVRPVFEERLREAFPLRAERVLHAVRDTRAGRWNDPRFGARMEGTGPRWEAVRGLFDLHCRRLGLNSKEEESESAPNEGGPAPEIAAEPVYQQSTLFESLAPGAGSADRKNRSAQRRSKW